MSTTDVAVIIGGTLVGLIAIAVITRVCRARSRRKKRVRRRTAASGGTWTPAARSVFGTGQVKDRRTLWARRYGPGGRWTTAAWTAGASASGLYLAETRDMVGDPRASCSGS